MCQNTPQLCCGDEWLKKFVFEISVAEAMNSTIPAPWGGDSRIQEISLL
jgi:hypothetical protein